MTQKNTLPTFLILQMVANTMQGNASQLGARYPKDYLAGVKLPTLRLINNTLYLLSQSQSKFSAGLCHNLIL